MAAFVYMVREGCPDQFGSETELCWSDVGKLDVEHLFQLALWLSRRVQLLCSGHAEAQLQIDAFSEVHALTEAAGLMLSCVRHGMPGIGQVLHS